MSKLVRISKSYSEKTLMSTECLFSKLNERKSKKVKKKFQVWNKKKKLYKLYTERSAFFLFREYKSFLIVLIVIM